MKCARIVLLQQELAAKIAEREAQLAKGGDGAKSKAAIDARRVALASGE